MLTYQRATGGLYRSATTDEIMTPWFKFERYDLIQPEIIVLGSSRALQFRQEHFSRPFANMGMGFDYGMLPNVARALLDRPNRLKVVILSIDFWQAHTAVYPNPPDESWDPRRHRYRWNPAAPLRANLAATKEGGRELVSKYISGSLNLLLMGRMNLKDAFNVIRHRDKSGRPTENRGVAAMLDGSGIAADGSYYYDWIFGGPRSPPGFEDVFDRIKNLNQSFERADAVDSARWVQIEKAIAILRGAGVKVIVIIPPVAMSVSVAMKRSGNYGVLDDMAAKLRGDESFFNFHDGASFGSGDCEFVDGYHGGEVTSLRMINAMATASRTGLSEYVELEKIRATIDRFSGNAAAYVEPRTGDRTRREGDFLSLGCHKR